MALHSESEQFSQVSFGVSGVAGWDNRLVGSGPLGDRSLIAHTTQSAGCPAWAQEWCLAARVEVKIFVTRVMLGFEDVVCC